MIEQGLVAAIPIFVSVLAGAYYKVYIEPLTLTTLRLQYETEKTRNVLLSHEVSDLRLGRNDTYVNHSSYSALRVIRCSDS